MMKKILILMLGVSLLLSSCGGEDGNKYSSKISKKKPAVKREKESWEQLSKGDNTANLRKEASPKTPDLAIRGFLEAIKAYKSDKAYAYLSSASQKEISKDSFLGKLGYENPFGKFLNECIEVKQVAITPQGNTGEGSCTVVMPNLYLINKTIERIMFEWGQSQTANLKDEQLTKSLMSRLETKDKKLNPQYTVSFSFTAYLVQEEGCWWVDCNKTWKSLQTAYEQAASNVKN